MLLEREDGRYEAESSLADEEVHTITRMFQNVLGQLWLTVNNAVRKRGERTELRDSVVGANS